MDELVKRIWYELTHSKYRSIYTFIYNARLRRRERRINWFITIASSGSVAGWWIWTEIPWLWTIIIIASQLLNVSKPYILNFSNSDILHDLQWYYESENHSYDQLWLNISRGALTEKKIEERYKEISEKYFTESQKYHKIRLKEDEQIKEIALKEWETHLKNKYNVEFT
ncbi:MAG: hypothetical protein IH947_09110 [Bacteroidetes bacterium]|nr:hypothetical protein [Bacteroidota bacterium]